MGIRELRKEAGRLGIKYSGLRKAELEPLVTAALAAENSASMDETVPVVKHSEQPKKSSLPSIQVVGNEIDGQPAVNVLAGMSKGAARKFRKSLRAVGRTDLAGLDVRKAFASEVAA